MVKVNLGSGNEYLEGYINVDDGSIFDSKRDVTADLFDYDMPLNSVDEILLSHVAMYIRPEEMEYLLKRWHRWLKVGGKIEIETIDLLKAMEFATGFDDSRVDSWGLTNIFGTKDTGPHRWGWFASKLAEQLTLAGFRFITHTTGTKKPNRDYKLIATK